MSSLIRKKILKIVKIIKQYTKKADKYNKYIKRYGKMGDWADLRNNFYDWLKKESQKENSKLDSEEVEKINAKKAAVEYSDEFRDYIKSEKTDEEEFTKSAIDLDKEDDNFLDELFDDYTSTLDKDDKVFKAIDKNED